jgi:superfamily II DNA or RNA helicase
MEIVDRNNTNTAIRIFNIVKKIKQEKGDVLKTHQKIVNILMKNYDLGTRGLLIYHQMGVGKTITALATAMEFRGERQIIILLTKSLQENFKNQIVKYLKLSGRAEEAEGLIKTYFTFISSNSSNMASQMAQKTNFAEDSFIEEKFRDISRINLDGKFLIVDEAHNLFRMITNGSKNALALYDAIKSAKNLKLLFLSGTPIANDPFELVPCFNMLSNNKTHPLFPEDYRDFEKFFVAEKGIKNKEKFQNRIIGLVSFAEISEELKKHFPEKLEISIERVPMEPNQYLNYLLAREKESDEGKKFFGKDQRTAPGTKPKSSAISSYKVKSRQISNFSPPKDKVITSASDIEEIISPKFDSILKNITSSEGSSLVYSQFIGLGGLGSFAEFLNRNKFSEFSFSYSQVAIEKKSDNQKYAFITGEVPFDMRTKIIDEFNRKENMGGDIIKALLVSSTGAEGLDLKNLRTIHIMEPYWNYGRIDQIQARGVRLNSHDDLPDDKKNVKTYIYLAVHPLDSIHLDDETTDEELYHKSVINKILIDSFLDAVKGASVECQLYDITNCRVCQPTDEKLFMDDFYKDIQRGDPCAKSEKKTVTVDSIEIEGQKFYYSPDPNELYDYNVYVYKPDLDSYAKMQDDDDRLEFITGKIKELA